MKTIDLKPKQYWIAREKDGTFRKFFKKPERMNPYDRGECWVEGVNVNQGMYFLGCDIKLEDVPESCKNMTWEDEPKAFNIMWENNKPIYLKE